MADDYLPDILRGFLAESRSYLAGLRDLTRRSGSPADLAEGYRLLHCVRGAASMLNLDGLAAIAEGGEALLEDAAQGERPLEPEGQARLAQTLDAVERALTELEAGLPPPLAAPEPEPAALAPQVPSLRGSQAGDVMEGFLEEAEELLAAVGNAVRDAERDPAASSGALLEIRRRVHTLKGTAAMVGFGEVARLSHALEDVLEGADGRERIGVVHEAVDLLDDLVHRPDDAEVSSRVEPLVTRLLAGAAPAAAPPEPAVAEPGAAPRPAAPQQEQLRVPLERVETLVRVASELVVQRSMLERVHRELVRHAGELGLSLKRLHGVSDRLETGYEALALAGTGGASGSFLPAGATEFDELELDRYTEFHILTRGLAETVSDVQAVGTELAVASSDIDAFLQRQQRLLRELQDNLLRLRAVPVSTLGSRFDRAVRMTAEASGKQVRFVFEGESVELDKSLLDSVSAPLLHLARNAVAHGIEPPEVRGAAGKPVEGEVRFTARYQGGQAVFEVADDGAGVDLAAVRSVAANLGLPVEALADDDVVSLIFLPGFTTARTLSETAGRGVGLDAVQAQIEALRGTVTVASEPGKGARFVVRLPLSLAITRALLVETAGFLFAVPAAAISRVLRIDATEVQRKLTGSEAGGALIQVDGEDLPVRSLRDILRLPATGGAAEAGSLMLVLDLGDYRAAALVDRLVDSRDLVVKPLGPLLRRVEGLAGATILGDGGVVPILDPYTLPRWDQSPARRLPELPAAVPAAGRLEVLIVDDSLSVRRVLSNLVAGSGWVPVAARDGLEALELVQARRRPFDIVLLDIEMPRMDGFELTAALRGIAEYAGVPIVMLTSRAGLKHRDKAFGLGVSEYLVKPFEPEALIGVVERLAVAVPLHSAQVVAPPGGTA